MKQALKCDFTWADFKTNSDGMVPVVVQDAENDEVLMLAYMNEEAFETTLRLGKMTYWSRSRNELWTKRTELRPCAVCKTASDRLRQRYNPCQSRTGRRSVPHRKPHLLLPDPGRIKIFDSEHKKSSCFTE